MRMAIVDTTLKNYLNEYTEPAYICIPHDPAISFLGRPTFGHSQKTHKIIFIAEELSYISVHQKCPPPVEWVKCDTSR